MFTKRELGKFSACANSIHNENAVKIYVILKIILIEIYEDNQNTKEIYDKRYVWYVMNARLFQKFGNDDKSPQTRDC